MTPQILELLFLAGIAFIIINKLIATLGSTNSNDLRSGKSFFGEKSRLKDVTPLYDPNEDKATVNSTAIAANAKMQEFLVVTEDDELIKAIIDLQSKLPNFKIANFIRNSKNAFQMIVEAASNAQADLTDLVDKRYIEKAKEIMPNYGNFTNNLNNLEAKISEAYSFGNSLFIKVLFTGQNITQNCQNLKEEWTFSKNLLQNSPIWYLNNIDKVQTI